MPRAITIEDLYRFTFVSRPRISPDGQRVAMVVATIDGRKHEYRTTIWIVQSGGGEAQRFTAGPSNSHSPSWSPDGRWLAFVSERAGELEDKVNKDEKEKKTTGKSQGQVWLIPTYGGEAHQLTFLEHGAGNPIWSPDSKYVVVSAPVGPADEETEDGEKLPKARVIDRLWYRLDGAGFIHERRNHLFLVPIAGGEPRQLTTGDWDENDPIWSPDGKQIAFVSSRAEDRWRLPAPDVYTLAIEDGAPGELQCLTDGTLSCASPSWSPDGQTVAFLASLKLRSGNHVDLYTIAAPAKGEQAKRLTGEFEGTCSDWTNSDMGDDHLMPPPGWSADGNTLYVLASHRGATRLFAIPTAGANELPATLASGEVHVRDFTVDRAANHLAMLIAGPTGAPEIYVCPTAAGGELRRVTSFNDALFQELTLVLPEYIPYTGYEGWSMDAWILKPHDFDPAKKYPLILQIHGGPATQYGYGFFHEMQLLAAAGYVVLLTNPRGSCGYGREFALAVRGAWGEKDSLDIMAGVDTLLQKGYIDEGRMGVIGGSYGGYMTNWLIGHTNRFKAAVSDRSVNNLASEFGSSDFGWIFSDDELETTPWDGLETYMRLSPITYVKAIHTPLLIMHSEQDLRCNIEQAEQLFTALKYLGREVLFVRFEGQSHSLSRGGHPKLRLERLRHILGWFEKYLK